MIKNKKKYMLNLLLRSYIKNVKRSLKSESNLLFFDSRVC